MLKIFRVLQFLVSLVQTFPKFKTGFKMLRNMSGTIASKMASLFQRSGGRFWSKRVEKKSLPKPIGFEIKAKLVKKSHLKCNICGHEWMTDSRTFYTRDKIRFVKRKQSIVFCPECKDNRNITIEKYEV